MNEDPDVCPHADEEGGDAAAHTDADDVGHVPVVGGVVKVGRHARWRREIANRLAGGSIAYCHVPSRDTAMAVVRRVAVGDLMIELS